MNKEEVLKFLASQKADFLEKFKITKIGLFGSMARSEKAKDINIIVEFRSETPDLFDKKFELKRLLELKFKMRVDISREKSIKPRVKDLIMQDAFVWQGDRVNLNAALTLASKIEIFILGIKSKHFRNFVAHNYFGLDSEEIWQLNHSHLPQLKNDVKKI